MDLVFDYVLRGVADVFFTADGSFDLLPVSMVFAGLIGGIIVGATPGLNGPFAMALMLPILISLFGVNDEALLPILGVLIGIMKGATLGGAVPAILFNTPGTPDAFLTTLDGHPMALKGQGLKALKIAHFSSVSGDTFSDIVLFVSAPVLAVMIENVLDLPEKASLIILSLSFMAAVAGRSPVKGLIVGVLGMLLALMGSTLSGNGPRMTFGIAALGNGLPLTSAILGVLVLSELAGAAQELGDAVIINPYDVEGFADGLETALDMALDERHRHMRVLRRVVAGRDVLRWASDVLEGLEHLDPRSGPPASTGAPRRPRRGTGVSSPPSIDDGPS